MTKKEIIMELSKFIDIEFKLEIENDPSFDKNAIYNISLFKDELLLFSSLLLETRENGATTHMSSYIKLKDLDQKPLEIILNKLKEQNENK
ncbi:MAG: hypothetical protein ACRCXT_16740 [Paraclostridium sp.]